MSTQPGSELTFTRWRKFSIGLNVFLIILAALAVLVMVNYLSHDYYRRWQWSTRTKAELSPRTLGLLRSITNQVKVILYYDRKEPLYSVVSDLLNQYSLASQRISVQTVDYVRDPGAAQKLKTDYKQLAAVTDKNLIIFECQGRLFHVDGNALTHYVLEQVPNEKQRTFRRRPAEFAGENLCSYALLAVTSPKRLQACFVQGHKEHNQDSASDFGYLKFANLLQQNYIDVRSLSLLGTNAVPPECNLLIIAGPTDKFLDLELNKLDQYLAQGGRLFVLFNSGSISKETGMDTTGLVEVLAKWGVQVGSQVITDPDHAVSSRYDMTITEFNQKHPVVNPLLGSFLYVITPRPISKIKAGAQPADAPRIEELAFTGSRATTGASAVSQAFPILVSVEKGAVQGVNTERGSTRLIVVGDSLFLANGWIDAAAGNRDFANSAINWLLHRTQLLDGVGPRPIKEYKILMSRTQLQRTQWVLLGGLPGGVLVLGSLVWLRRRK